MKKLSFLVFYKEYQEFLEKIRDLGVIHVIENQQGAINDVAVQDKMQKLARYASVMETLEKMVDKKSLPAADENIDFPSLLAQWDKYQLDKAATEARIQALSKDEQLLAPWGDFDPSSIELLEKQGYCINFF
ncbi:MAG: hypothetical protein J6V49_00220, partial [Bacteroidales bacterium]|nr:hypothetical protein [Bacteroidales bacterium]